ncbi:MAG: helix-turn-helix domain-containing protein [Actinomycetota bacterium]
MDTKTLLDSACPLIGELGSAFYFIPETGAVGKELGLGGMEFYVLGRGGSMGDCDGRAIAAAFGYFNPDFLTKVWGDAAAKCPPRKAGSAHLECAANLGRAKFGSLAGLDGLVAALDKVRTAVDPDGLGLYAAMATEPLASDAPGRAMQLIALLREFRGSAHLVALRTVGLASPVAHAAKRPDMWNLFGHPEESKPEITAEVTAKLAEAEAITDRIVEPAYAVLTDAERDVLVAGMRAVKDAHKAG